MSVFFCYATKDRSVLLDVGKTRSLQFVVT